MKKLLFTFIAFSLMTGASCQKKADIEKEKEVIKTTIEKFIVINNELDLEGWVNSYVKDDYTFISSASSENHFFIQGWENIYELGEEAKKGGAIEAKEAGSYYTQEPFDFSYIKVYGDAAWVQFKIKWTTYENNVKTMEDASLELYFLEKHDGEWKIAGISAVQISSYEVEAEAVDNGNDDDE